MRILSLIAKICDNINKWVANIAIYLAVPLSVVLVVEVVSRYFFSSPTYYAYDLSYMFYGAHFMLLSAYTLSKGGHIRTDFLYRKWSVKTQGKLDAFIYLFIFIPGTFFIFWLSYEFAIHSIERQQRAMASAWMPPIYPLKTVMAVSFFLLTLQCVGEFCKACLAAIKGEWE